MAEFFGVIFNILTDPLSLPLNPFLEYLILGILEAIAYRIAYSIVGELGFHGSLGSTTHWTIRIIMYVAMWALVEGIIELVIFVKQYYIWCIATLVAVALTVIALLLIKHSKKGTANENNER